MSGIPIENSHHATSEAAPSSRKSISIWFFVGILCLGYGLVLIGAGIYQFGHPPAVYRPELHATFWWGVLMTIFGSYYTIRFR